MRIHKVYNRISSLSSSSPFLSTLSIGTLKPLLKRNLVTKPIRFSMRSSPSSSSSSSNRFHNLVPVKAAAASAVGGGGGAENSSLHGSHTAITYEEEDELAIGGGYRLPPPEIKDIVDAPPLPALSFSPKRDKILFLKRRALPPLSDLAKPEEKLAGVRIDGKCNTRSRMSSYTGIGIHQLLPDGMLGPEKEIHGFPDGAKINFVSWSPDGRHLSFSIRFEEENGSSKLRVWVADVETGKANPVFQSPDIYLNAIFDNFVWVNDSTLLVCTIPLSRGDPPKKPIVPSGPKIQSNEQKSIIQVRTFQDLLKDEYDEDLFDYYTTTQLVLASLDGTVKEIGSPGIYTSMDPSPDEKYVLISSLHRPYSFIVPCGRFPKKVELWTTDGQFVREICDLPLAEDIPIAFNSVRKGMRSINWRADKPSQLYWVETQDGGDAKVEVSPRDIIFTQRADAPDGVEPEILHKLDLRYGGISWCDDSLALVYESWYKTRRTRTWVISPGSEDVSPRILFDRSSEDVYSDPGSPMSRRTPAETYVIAKVNKENDGNTYFLLNGSGATPEGNVPFLDLFDINSGTKERIWQSDKDKYFETVVALMSDQNEGDLHLDQLKILTSKESKTENTQYYMQTWPDKKACQITNFPHPYPQLATLQKEMIRYTRKDGVQLTATLYLPPGYDASKDGPLPCLFWSYPGEFKSKEAAGQVRGSPNEFSGIGPTSALLWLARRFAILSGPTIPIIGEGDEEANDRYVEQLVTSAEAAVEEVIRRGVAHPNKIAVGGHSYGAFMTANLLAHAPHLFSCGIARSGAYNRTLTPFGFQNEERTLWDAPKTYSEMSPFMAANKIKKPILLIHGEEDNNSGTLTMQSDRFFNALKGHGALSRLVILPFESHGYAARESIMHVLWESDRWLQKYCVSNTSNVNEDLDSSKDNLSKETTNSESKPASVSGGGSSEQTDDEHGAFPYLPRSLLCLGLLSLESEEDDAFEFSSEVFTRGWTINTKYYSADVSVWMAHLHEGFSINALPIYDRLAALVMVFDTNDLLSLSALKEWVSHTDIHKFDILLCIGNKVDLLQGHSAHAEYRRRLLKKSKNSSTKSYEEVEYGISETEGSSLLGEEETSLDFRDSCLEWCSEHGIEYIEACASNAYFDKCLSVDGDSQGVDRLYGALSAHMWPGMILKSGNKILEPSLPEYEDSSEEDSDVDFDYEVLSAGSVEQWDETDEGWVSATASTSTGEPVIQNDNVKVFGKEQEPVIVSNNEDKKPSTSADQLQGGDIDESEAPKLHETDSDTESRQGTNINIEDLEQLMSEISNTRDSLRLMPDFQRREMAAKLAMKMASMFGGSDDDDER